MDLVKEVMARLDSALARKDADPESDAYEALQDIRRDLTRLSSKAAAAKGKATSSDTKKAAAKVESMLDECCQFIHGL